MPRTFVTKYETARRTLSFIDVVKICNALDVNVLEIINQLNLDNKKPKLIDEYKNKSS